MSAGVERCTRARTSEALQPGFGAWVKWKRGGSAGASIGTPGAGRDHAQVITDAGCQDTGTYVLACKADSVDMCRSAKAQGEPILTREPVA